MPTYFSPKGNPEIWNDKPDGYFSGDEWIEHNINTGTPLGKTLRISAINARLAELDADSIRPLRAIAAGIDTEDDRRVLQVTEAMIAELREELAAF